MTAAFAARRVFQAAAMKRIMRCRARSDVVCPVLCIRRFRYSAFFNKIANVSSGNACAAAATDSQTNIDSIAFAEGWPWQKS
jgi:hypothetical protein